MNIWNINNIYNCIAIISGKRESGLGSDLCATRGYLIVMLVGHVETVFYVLKVNLREERNSQNDPKEILT